MAQQNNETQVTQNKAVAEGDQKLQGFSEIPFDDSLKMLPANFIGHDPKQLYQTLAGALKEKDEFETTADYNERIKNALKEPLFGRLTPLSTFAVSANMQELEKYDADKRIFNVQALVYDAPKKTDSNSVALDTSAFEEKSLGIYKGENAFGAKRDIEKKERWIYRIVLKDAQRFNIKEGDVLDSLPFIKTLSFSMPMETDAARAAKPNLKLLIIFNLVAPYIEEKTDYLEPTVDFPTDVTAHKYYIHADVKSLWLYNSVTGEVYARQESH